MPRSPPPSGSRALRGCLDAFDGLLDLVEQGQHIAGIARIALGHTVGKDKARGRLRHDAGLAAKLGGAIALAFEDGGNGGIVGIDDFTVAEFFALGEPCGLLADVRMARCIAALNVAANRSRCGVTERCRLGQEVLGLLPKRGDGLAKLRGAAVPCGAPVSRRHGPAHGTGGQSAA